MENTYFYNTTVKWKEGKIGELLETGFPSIEIATPSEFPKGVPNICYPNIYS